MPRKEKQITEFGTELITLGCYVVHVKYYPAENFATLDREILDDKLRAFERRGWTVEVKRYDLHKLPDGARANGEDDDEAGEEPRG